MKLLAYVTSCPKPIWTTRKKSISTADPTGAKVPIPTPTMIPKRTVIVDLIPTPVNSTIDTMVMALIEVWVTEDEEV
jgi:hypothetical protein